MDLLRQLIEQKNDPELQNAFETVIGDINKRLTVLEHTVEKHESTILMQQFTATIYSLDTAWNIKENIKNKRIKSKLRRFRGQRNDACHLIRTQDTDHDKKYITGCLLDFLFRHQESIKTFETLHDCYGICRSIQQYVMDKSLHEVHLDNVIDERKCKFRLSHLI
jgi:hypothetical protein